MKNCDQNCGSCGNCAGCGGCGNTLSLTDAELALLQSFAQCPFLPVARKADDMTPIYLEEQKYSQQAYSLALQLLERKELVDLDYGSPLKGADMSRYAGFPVHGSAALTARGQRVLEILQLQGIEQE